MNETVDRFIRLSFLLAFVFSSIMVMPLAWTISMMGLGHPVVITLAFYLLLFLLIFIVIFKIPYFNKQKLGKKIEGEVAVTGRRLLIQLDSGKSLVNSIIDVAKNKKESSKALERVAYELYMGKPLENAIQDAIDTSPSPTFRKIFIQIRNSMKTGADLKLTLRAVLEDVTRDKIVEFESFGKRLSPVGLFYMLFGTIAPSLGIVIMAVFLTAIGISIDAGILTVFILVIGVIQIFFIMIFSGMRPELEI